MISILLICLNIATLLLCMRINKELARMTAAYEEAEEVITIQNANLEVADVLLEQMMEKNKILSRRLDMRVVK